jgi:hypothetical protein
VIGELYRSARRAHTGQRQRILHSDRDAVERTPRSAGEGLGIGAVSGLARPVEVEGDHRVDRDVRYFDSIDEVFEQLP